MHVSSLQVEASWSWWWSVFCQFTGRVHWQGTETQHADVQDERSFSEEEEQKLERAFSCDAQEVTLLLESLSFILEQVGC